MATTESLKATIESTEDLHSVVKTMKALAAVKIRQYEKAYASLTEYFRTVEMGFHIVMKHEHFAWEPKILKGLTKTQNSFNRLGAIIIGSDQGLCGQFNERIAAYAIEQLEDVPQEDIIIAIVGARPLPTIQAAGYSISEQFSVPDSAAGITDKVQEILLTIEEWRTQQQVDRINLYYNQPESGASYSSQSLQLLPLDLDWLRSLEEKEWYTEAFPTFTMDEEELFAALVREYLFVALYRALAASLASENASRLASMQSAQKNIEERLGDLNAQYRRQRQSSITSELMDVVAGSEALT